MTEVNKDREYFCIGAAKFLSDKNEVRYLLRCNPNGQYDSPDWPHCATSKSPN